MVHKRSNIKLWPFFLFIAISCTSFKAYFNTFYNAEELFQKAEEIRQKTENDKLPKTALDHYEKVIQKSRFILDEYPVIEEPEMHLDLRKSQRKNSIVRVRVGVWCLCDC